jgi:hypothetical protein
MIWVIVSVVLILFFLFILGIARMGKEVCKCEKCGHYAEKVNEYTNGERTIVRTFFCKKCGNVIKLL